MGTVSPARLLPPVRRKVAAKYPNAPTSLAGALFTTTQQRILALLFGQPNRSFFTKELIRLTGSGSGAVQRELQRLASSGLAKMTPIGMQKHYQANPDCPVYHELVSMVWKTVALAEPVRQALEPFVDRIKLAMIYGSVARGTDTAASDIDLLVEYVPDVRVGLFDMGGHLVDLTEIIGRKVDLVTPKGLCKYIRDEVLETARIIYAKES